jgi:transcriptional regulator with XRE-family HTH domain
MFGMGKELPQLETLGGRIRAVRTARKLRVGDTAKKIGVSRTSLTSWETNSVKIPDVDKLAAFTRLTEVSLDWLIEGKGEEPEFLAQARRSKPRLVVEDGAEDARTVRAAVQQQLPEVASSLTAHAKAIDMTPRAFWSLPHEVLELGFNVEPSAAVMKRVITRDGGEFGLARGDFVLIDTSRNRIDEPGTYLLADPEGKSARRARVELQDGKLQIVILGDDVVRDNPQDAGDDIVVLGRVMGVFRPC